MIEDSGQLQHPAAILQYNITFIWLKKRSYE